MKLELAVDYWTDFVGAFDPRKVVILVKRAFPETIIDPTDYAAERLHPTVPFISVRFSEPRCTRGQLHRAR